MAPVGTGRKTGQSKHTADNRPCQSRKSNTARTRPHPVFADQRVCPLCCQMNPFRISQSKHQSHPKKLFAIATATSLSPASRGNVKVPFSSEHHTSGTFLASSTSNRSLSAYTSFPFTNIHSSRVHPIFTFFVCFVREVIVVFSHAAARLGSGRGRPYRS